jgi:hypothetical protein
VVLLTGCVAVLRLVFTCIHPAAPLRECVVGVRVLEDDATYQVNPCVKSRET